MYILCQYMLEVWNLLFDFTGGCSKEIALSLRRGFRLLNSAERLWGLGLYECILYCGMAMSLYRGQGAKCCGLSEKCSLETWTFEHLVLSWYYNAGRFKWHGLEEVCHCD